MRQRLQAFYRSIGRSAQRAFAEAPTEGGGDSGRLNGGALDSRESHVFMDVPVGPADKAHRRSVREERMGVQIGLPGWRSR